MDNFIDHSKEILQLLEEAKEKTLEEWGLAGENFAKTKITENGSVDTGELRNSITHKAVPEESATYIGTDVEHGKYVELGTGVFTAGGRPTPWVYQDEQGNWHRTSGQVAKPYLKPAVADHKDTYRQIAEKNMKNA